MSKIHARKGASWNFEKSNFFPENQQQMEHSNLLMVPDYY
jgi:hypothetical protein